MLVVEGLKKSYGQAVLTDLYLSVSQGEFVGIVGENGCGKSTLLEILAGAVKPDEGLVLLQGESVSHNPRLFAKNIGYVPQENPIIDELTVLDNLSLWYCGKYSNLKQDLIDGPPIALGLAEVLKKKAGTLSGGMKKRLSIACALAAHSPLLLLDEPSAALDIVCKRELHNYFKEYQKKGGTIIMTSHEEAEIHLCSRLYVLKSGKLQEISTTLTGDSLAELIKEPLIHDVFLQEGGNKIG